MRCRLGIVRGLVLAVTLTTALGVPLAASAREFQQASIRIGYVLPDLANPFIASLRDGAAAEADKDGITLLVKGTNDAAGQTNAFLDFLGAGVDLIAVDTIDGDAIAPAVEQANAAGIPVIAIQAQPRAGTVATFIAADNTEGGRMIGQAIVEYCGSKDPCKLGVVEGDLADQSGRDEDSGMRSAVADHPNIQIVAHQPTNYDPQRALNVATDMLTANPDLDYIYSWWDQGALSALEAARARGVAGKIGISGFGGNCQNLAEVISGNIQHETVFFPDAMGALMVQRAMDVLNGNAVPNVSPAPIFSLTSDLAQNLLSGAVEPPAELPIMDKLAKAQSGCQ
jgi:ABC-type sugar transport system substrate-binding protein